MCTTYSYNLLKMEHEPSYKPQLWKARGKIHFLVHKDSILETFPNHNTNLFQDFGKKEKLSVHYWKGNKIS